MAADIQYARIFRAYEGFKPFIGDYLTDKLKRFDRQEITAHELTTELRFIDRKMETALTEFEKIRFPQFSQRMAYSKFLDGIREYRKALSTLIRALEKSDEKMVMSAKKRFDRASAKVRKFASFAFKDRLKLGMG